MTIRAKGFHSVEGEAADLYGYDAAAWSRLWSVGTRKLYKGQWAEPIAVTRSANPRTLNVSRFSEVLLPGLMVESDEAESITFPSVSGPRWGRLFLEANWATRTVALKPVVASSTGSVPQPDQRAGVLWQTSLARVQLAAGMGAFAANQVTLDGPRAARAEPFYDEIPANSVNYNGSAEVIATIPIPDFGYPYHLEVDAQVPFTPRLNGKGRIVARSRRPDDSLYTLGIGTSERLDRGGASAMISRFIAVEYSGPVTVELSMVPVEMTSGTLSVDSQRSVPYSYFNVTAHPAF